MAQTTVNEFLQTQGIEEKIMKATGLTKNVVAKMLCNANETEDEVEKARILSHFIWHMPAGQLQATPEAKAEKKELIQELANEIGTEMPEEWSSLEIEVSKPEVFDDGLTPVEPQQQSTPAEDNTPAVDDKEPETPAEEGTEEKTDDTNALLFKFSGKKNKASKKEVVEEKTEEETKE